PFSEPGGSQIPGVAQLARTCFEHAREAGADGPPHAVAHCVVPACAHHPVASESLLQTHTFRPASSRCVPDLGPRCPTLCPSADPCTGQGGGRMSRQGSAALCPAPLRGRPTG